MANLFDYLKWRGDLLLEQDGLNEVDALILSRVSYAPYEKISLDKEGPQPIKKVAKKLISVEGIERSFIWPEDMQLLEILIDTPRFQDLELSHFVNQIDPERQKQFSAVTIKLEENRYFISFRGTDDTVVGWKENFNMTFMSPVPAQVSAVEYLEAVADSVEGELIPAGHSKGGNLAMYASAFCDESIQDRIHIIYSFDGPGFTEAVLDSPQYKEHCKKMVSFVPQSSIVGMLLEHEEQYSIIKSVEKSSFLQHNVYTWEVQGNHLIHLDEVTGSSRFIDHTLQGLLQDMEVEEREKVVDAIYQAFLDTDIYSLKQLDDKWFNGFFDILGSLISLDKQTREVLKNAFSKLMKNARLSIGGNGREK